MKMKIKIGRKYRELFTNAIVEVIWKTFFDVGYRDIKTNRKWFVHHKTFRKYWITINEENKNENES